MIKFNDIVPGPGSIISLFFVFKSQYNVLYRYPYSKTSARLTKIDLIVCIKTFISRLESAGYRGKLNSGFVLPRFNYYELSVYLHGLLQLYGSIMGDEPLEELHITRFSRLPHEVLKPEKETLVIEVATVKDPEGPICYCCVIGYIPICSLSIERLKKRLLARFPHWKSKYNILLNVK